MLKSLVNVVFILVIAFSSYLMIMLSLPYLSFLRDVEFLQTKQFVVHLVSFRFSFYVHVFSSAITLIAGIFIFPSFFRNRIKIHRFFGKIYIFFVLFISGPSGLVLAFYANGGFWAKFSFVLLSILWIIFTLFGFIKIKKGEIVQHKKWMLRSYALTLSAISLRFLILLANKINIDVHPVDLYIAVSYLSWTINLLLIESVIYFKYLLNNNSIKVGS